MEESKSAINYIFYLQTKNDLESTYIMLSEILNKLNITLLPIRPEELKVLDKSAKNHIVVLRNDISSALIFNEYRKSYFDMAMMSGRISIYDLSSFSEIENIQKLTSKNSYRYIPLPANIKQIAMIVAVDFFKERNVKDEWPGGKRAKLPSMNT